VAAAFAHTFWWAIGAILIAFIPTLFLQNRAAVTGEGDVGVGGGGGDGDGAGVEGAVPGTAAPVTGAMID
jgi:hypothetical protein